MPLRDSPSPPPLAPLRDSRIVALQAAVESDGTSLDARIALARAFNARCMPEDARRACDSVLARDPSHPDAWHEAVIAASFGESGELNELRPAVENQARTHDEEAWAHRNLALLSYFQGRDEDTRSACERALLLDPDDAKSHELLAFLAYTIGDMDAAVEAGIKALELDPSSTRALHWLGECYVKLGARSQAERYFLRVLALEDCHFLALESLGSLALQDAAGGQLAWQCFGRILSANPRYFPAWFHLADAFIQQDRLEEAAGMAASVLRLAPDRSAEADAHQYLGLIALMQADVARARPHFEGALEIDPEFAAAHHYLAFDRKEYETARRHFRAAVTIDDTEYLAHLGLGEIARWRKDYLEQLEHCRRAAELAPDDSNVRNQLGTAYDALGETALAAEGYEEALRLDPHDRQAANNLGYLRERELKDCSPDDEERIRALAVAAWKRRLLICRDTRSSTKGAKTHLLKLGVSAAQVSEWLEQGQVA